MVRPQLAAFSDVVPALDCRVAEWSDSGIHGAAAPSLRLWSKYSSLDGDGNLFAGSQFRVLAFVVRWRVAGSRSHREMHLCGRVPVLAVATRRRRPARIARELAAW